MEHFRRLARLLEMERAAEIEQNKLELERFSPEVREALGKTVTRLAAEEAPSLEGGFPVLELSRPGAAEDLSPFHAMNRGDLVSVETPEGRRWDGTLSEVTESRVRVALNANLAGPVPRGRWSLHLIGSDATYRRMKQALRDVAALGPKTSRLRDVLLGNARTEPGKIEDVSFKNRSLNHYQQDAVRSALAAEDAALIHGPPGTGKTTVLTEIIFQAAAAGRRVIASAPSNIAVDNILEKLLPLGLRVVRLGHPARTSETLRHATLAFQAQKHPDSKRLRDLDATRERLLLQRARRADRVGLGWDERHQRQSEIKELWTAARDMEKDIAREIMQGAQVVLVTHGSIGRSLGRQTFDLAVLDEASQATEPLSWIALLRARKAIFAGDPLQLPPTLYSEPAAKEGLALTLFERLMPLLPESLKTLLRVQYRMNEAIMEFPSRRFYDGKLIADDSVRDHLLAGLPDIERNELTEAPFLFIDTAGTGFQETWDALLQSRSNREEAGLAARLFNELRAAGVPARDIAVVTPYVAQMKTLKALLPGGVEVGTVDGFQGREKEAVILSLVRSNNDGEVGFLQDARRLNVALTRARRSLIVIGDSATIAAHPLFVDFLDHAEKVGAHRSAWDWLQKS